MCGCVSDGGAEYTHVTGRDKSIRGKHAFRAMGVARVEFYLDTHGKPC